jgi:hypothetical protein
VTQTNWFFAWFRAFGYFVPQPERPPVSKYADLLATSKADLTTQATAADALAAATTSKTHADTDVSASTVAFAAAVKAAPGSTVVDNTVIPFVEYTSTDGLTVTSTVIAGIGDDLPDAPPAPPAP